MLQEQAEDQVRREQAEANANPTVPRHIVRGVMRAERDYAHVCLASAPVCRSGAPVNCDSPFAAEAIQYKAQPRPVKKKCLQHSAPRNPFRSIPRRPYRPTFGWAPGLRGPIRRYQGWRESGQVNQHRGQNLKVSGNSGWLKRRAPGTEFPD